MVAPNKDGSCLVCTTIPGDPCNCDCSTCRTKRGITLKFVVDGIPRGYCIQMGKFQNTPVKRRYVEYKKLVQAVAGLSGVELPLKASREAPVRVVTRAYFASGVHPDPENVHKGVKDALFYGAGGLGDKYTGGSYEPPLYDAERPRVEIEVFLP